ncbi:MAG TPA: hypothetical protein EYP59_12385 [Thiotrichaceae bacterium]|nr:hypothetical protein [Thiotrichaceae bacterium]
MKDLVMPYTESGITLDLSGLDYFCFENCKGYQKLSAHHFKEMDIGWYNVEEDTLYLVELKYFTGKNMTDSADQIIRDLVKKSIDSISMIIAVKAGTHYSASIHSCLPSSFKVRSSSIKLIHIINCTPEKESYIPFIRDKFQERFKAYKTLFDIQHCTVVSLRSAQKFFAQIQ